MHVLIVLGSTLEDVDHGPTRLNCQVEGVLGHLEIVPLLGHELDLRNGLGQSCFAGHPHLSAACAK